MTSTFKGTAEEYAEAWRQWHAKYSKNGILSKPDKYRFYNKVGVLYTEEGFKIKPNQSNRKHPTTGKKIDNWTNTLDGGRGDLTKAIRSRREAVLTYIFGGKELDITKAANNARDAGLGERTAHHKFGDAEFAPFIDDIVEGLMKPGTKAYKWAANALKSGRNHFHTSKWFAGNVEEAYRMLTKPQHLPQGEGNLNIHQMEADHRITRTSRGGSIIGMAKSQGTIHGLPSDEYIRGLPLERKYRAKLPGLPGPKHLSNVPGKYVRGPIVDGISQGLTPGLTRWDALETLMKESGPIRNELTQIAMKANPAKGDVLPNVTIGGGIEGKPGFQQYYGVNRYGDPASTALTGRPRLEQRVTGIDGLPADYSNEGKAAVNDIFTEIDSKQVKGAKFGGNVPTSVLRARAKQLALLGIAGVSVVGTGASAAETAIRTNIASQTGDWRDKAQAGISGFSLANDVGSYSGVWALPGAILSTGADGINWLIDDLRSNNSRLKQIDWDAVGKASYSLGGLI